MNMVKIYEVNCYEAPLIDETGRYFSLQPFGKQTRDFKGEDDGGKEYVLPDGFHVDKCVDGTPSIIDENGNCHQIFTDNDWLFPRPAISIDEPPYSMILEPRPNIFGIPIDGGEKC